MGTINDLVRRFMWGVCETLMKILNYILSSTVGNNGVLSFNPLDGGNGFVSAAFKACLALMPIILVSKISYEVVRGMIMDDDNDMNFQRKIASAFMGVTIAVSLTFLIPMANNLVKGVCNELINSDISTTQTFETVDNRELENGEEAKVSTSVFGDKLLISVLEAFGGMPTSGDYSATEMVLAYELGGDDFDINEKLTENGVLGIEIESDNYKWDCSTPLVMIGLAVYVVLFFIAMVQIALRMISITFFYIIGPICCTSLTNFQNPQAFTVWRNSLIGQWFMNAGQIFLIILFVQVIGSINNNSLTAIAKCALYFGSTTLVITAPSLIQGMIGGYGAGIMETLNSLRGGLGIAEGVTKGATGVIVGAVGATIGGGFAKAIGGQKSTSTDSSGATITSRSGGLIGALAGNKSTRRDGKGNTTTSRSGGVWGNWMGASSKTASADGSSTTTSQSGGVRGALFGDSFSSTTADSSGGEQGSPYGDGVSSSFTSGNDNRESGGSTTTTTRTGGLRGAFSGTSTSTSNGQTKTTTRVGGLGGMKNVMNGNKFSSPRTSTHPTWGSNIKSGR